MKNDESENSSRAANTTSTRIEEKIGRIIEESVESAQVIRSLAGVSGGFAEPVKEDSGS